MDGEDRFIDVARLVRAFTRYAWLLVVGAIVGGILAWWLSSGGVPKYQASTTLLIQQGATSLDISSSDIQASQDLAQTYQRIIKTRPILERAAERIGEGTRAESLNGSLQVTVVRGTQLLVITAETPGPETAATYANESAAAFIAQTREDRLAEIALTEQVAAAQGVSDVSGYIASQLASLQSLRVVEEAVPPGSPIGKNSDGPIAAGVVLGLIAASGAILALEYLRDALPSPDVLESSLGLVTLGSVGRFNDRTVSNGELAFDPDSHSTHTEEYRGLASNVVFAAAPHSARSFLITSALPAEGKTNTSVNLAMALAERGEEVALVDADLRRPSVMNMLSVDGVESGQVGLSSFLSEHNAVALGVEQPRIEAIRIGSSHSRPGLRIVPSGPLPPNPASLLSSERMGKLMEDLRTEYSLIIVDSPPILAVADSLAIAPHVDAVILVVDSQRTRGGQLRAAHRAIERTGVPIIGIVINKVDPKTGGGYGYGYYSYGGYSAYGEYLSTNGSAEAREFKPWHRRPMVATRSAINRVLRRH